MANKTTRSKATPVSSWRNDEKVVKLRKTLRAKARDSEAYFTEVKDYIFALQKKRIKYGRITHSEVVSRHQDKLVESIAQDKSHRSNIVEKRLHVLDQTYDFKDNISLIRRHIKTHYGPELKKEFGAITNQNEGIEDYFAMAIKVAKQGDLLISIIDMVIADIDKSHFADKALQTSAELIFHPGRAD